MKAIDVRSRYLLSDQICCYLVRMTSSVAFGVSWIMQPMKHQEEIEHEKKGGRTNIKNAEGRNKESEGKIERRNINRKQVLWIIIYVNGRVKQENIAISDFFFFSNYCFHQHVYSYMCGFDGKQPCLVPLHNHISAFSFSPPPSNYTCFRWRQLGCSVSPKTPAQVIIFAIQHPCTFLHFLPRD